MTGHLVVFFWPRMLVSLVGSSRLNFESWNSYRVMTSGLTPHVEHSVVAAAMGTSCNLALGSSEVAVLEACRSLHRRYQD